jgi:hypothetical protein
MREDVEGFLKKYFGVDISMELMYDVFQLNT